MRRAAVPATLIMCAACWWMTAKPSPTRRVLCLTRRALWWWVASTIAQALEQAQALRPDVVLVDISLGEESGFDVARALAQDGQGGGSTVIMISTLSGEDYEDLITESPVAGFLPKSELSALAIHQILDHSG